MKFNASKRLMPSPSRGCDRSQTHLAPACHGQFAQPHRGLPRAGFTIAEVVVSMAVAALAFSGIIYGYISASQRAEWSSYSLAAQSLAMQRMEQTRAAKWDPLGYPPVDNDFHQDRYPPIVEILDIPIAGTNIVYATNFTTIRDIPGPSPLRMVRVDCVWSFLGRGPFTNSIATYRSPDQ